MYERCPCCKYMFYNEDDTILCADCTKMLAEELETMRKQYGPLYKNDWLRAIQDALSLDDEYIL